jgi:hypothetical protein
MRFAHACVVAGAVLLCSSTAAAGDSLAAREQLKIGYLLAKQGRCNEALPHLTESLRLDVRAITLINLAQCEESVGRLADAMGHWVDARARAQAESARDIEEEAEKRATALEPRLARIAIVPAANMPKDAVIERDGAALGAASMGLPLPVNPGTHTITVKIKGHADAMKTVTLAEGELQNVEVNPGEIKGERSTSPAAASSAPASTSDASRKGSSSPLTWIGFGVAIPAVAAGAITGVMALGAKSDADGRCPEGRCSRPSDVDAAKDDVEKGKTMGNISTIAFAVGAVGIGVGVFGLLSSKSNNGASASVALVPGGATLQGRF